MTNDLPSLGKTAQAFAGAVTEGAQILGEQIRAALNKAAVTFDEEADARLLLRSLLFTLHLTDRFALAQLRFAGREQFMGALLAALVQDIEPTAIRTEYNNFQRDYGRFQQFLPEKESGFGGTLCWEFAKGLVADFCPNHVGMIPVFAYEASTQVVLVGKTFTQCVPQS